MNTTLIAALAAPEPSTRLRAALAAGTHPDPGYLKPLVQRFAVEPDFFVRDMLTWALTRLPAQLTVPVLLEQLADPRPRARSQALHTLSKIKDPATWPALHTGLLHDPDVEVASTAWRSALAVVPAGETTWLAGELARELGQGTPEIQRSLSRVLAELGEAAEPIILRHREHPDPAVKAHAQATWQLLSDPDADFLADLEAAKRVAALGPNLDN
ncbi:HEAT repeat domain-containing protein [Corynebacterium sp. A21]|uniref:HEAT repeat domain-containing protein n=1 Tax=Corynebacterium sp. A21 TaxID=3457318 RepID=UPI003FD254B5